MMLEPAIYSGTLRHRRFAPRRHEFTYSLFMALLDVDRISETMDLSTWSSYNQFNWAAFYERDHFGDPNVSLRERLRRDATAHGLTLPEGKIYLLTNLRYLGYCFNPISVYYCYGACAESPLVMAEVNSTFGESHNYWLGPHNALPGTNPLHFGCSKSLHVSPFMKMALDYEFALSAPAERLVAHINTLEQGNSIFDATLTLERESWTESALTKALWRQPMMTAKVIAAIHWEALRLFGKGLKIQPGPQPEGFPAKEAIRK